MNAVSNDRKGRLGLPLIVGLAAVAVLLAAGIFFLRSAPTEPDVSDVQAGTREAGEKPAATARDDRKKPSRQAEPAAKDATPPAASPAAAPEEPQPEPGPKMTEEEKEAEEEKRVEEFDKTVDKWMEPQGKSVTMEEVDKFRDMFRRVPKTRKEECVHRALNLIPDENVMLLAGILFDKEQDKEIVDLVYNDVLNRDEGVKKPILQQIFKDRGHPNWADTAWILDVTGELPNAKK